MKLFAKLKTVPFVRNVCGTGRLARPSDWHSLFATCGGWLLAFTFGAPMVAGAADWGEAFATPEAAVAALTRVVTTHDVDGLRKIFGPEADDLENPDRVQATNDLEEFAAALDTTHQLDYQSPSKCVVEVGASSWPFPVPIVKTNGSWFFDAETGEDELLSRRIGKNELAVLDTVRAYVDAQREYAGKYRDGADVLQYAQRLGSNPGRKDGLYWPLELDGTMSPLGPLVAEAQEQGYKVQAKGQGTTGQPFDGYYFKILTRQGKHAPGGKYDYIINGNMIGGFALVAWPAQYGQSGIMTFIVNQQGKVYQNDLGSKTEKLAEGMDTYDPGPGWSLSQD